METKNNLYQVFVFECPAHMPFWFASHHWFVVSKMGTLSRWEVVHRKNFSKTSWGYLSLNAYSPFGGIEIFPYIKRFSWKGKEIGKVEGDVAKEIIEFIENSPNTYPYCDKYSLGGPNSNTYAQWVLNKFPEFAVRLHWNSFGKDYKIKK